MSPLCRHQGNEGKGVILKPHRGDWWSRTELMQTGIGGIQQVAQSQIDMKVRKMFKIYMLPNIERLKES